MARIFSDTCGDLYDVAHIVPAWSTDSGRGTIAIVSGKAGATGSCIQLLNGNGGGDPDEFLRKNLPASYSRLIAGMRFQTAVLPVSGKRCIAAFWDALATLQTGVYVNADGSLALYRGGTTDAPSAQIGSNTAPNTIRGGVWAYIEIDLTSADTTAGAYELRVNSQTVHTESGLITATNSSGMSMFSINCVGVSDTDSAIAHYDDDVYVNDTTGATNNTFDGDIQGLVFLPTGPGQYTGMTIGGSAPAGTNWQSVNQAVPDDGATFVAAGSTGAKDTYRVGPLPANVAAIVCVTTHLDVETDTAGLAGGAQIAPLIGDGTTIAAGDSVSLNTNWDNDKQQNFGDNPITSAAWSPSDWDTIEVGEERTS